MNDPASQEARLEIRKRDGSVEPFSTAKLIECIRAGLHAAGVEAEYNGAVVRGLAEAVRDFARSSAADEPVPVHRIDDLVEQALSQTGYSEAAMFIREHARMRKLLRRRLHVAARRRNDGRWVHHRWDKNHLVQHLRRRQALEPAVARMIAARVEEALFACGLRVVTTGLVYEMSRSELLAWGLLPGALVVKRSRMPRRDRRVRDRSDPAA